MKIIAYFLILGVFIIVRPLVAGDHEAEGLKTDTVSQDATTAPGEPGNDPARCQWFEDQALGMFIHWSLDCPLGSVISHHE